MYAVDVLLTAWKRRRDVIVHVVFLRSRLLKALPRFILKASQEVIPSLWLSNYRSAVPRGRSITASMILPFEKLCLMTSS